MTTSRPSQLLNQKIRIALDAAEKPLKELHSRLNNAKKAHVLLSEIDEWGQRIQTAQGFWIEAQNLGETDPGLVYPLLRQQMQALAKALVSEDNQWELAKKLDELRLDYWKPTQTITISEIGEVAAGTPIRMNYDSALVDRKYADAFNKVGLNVPSGDTADLARRIRHSPIRYVLLAALDHWAFVANDKARSHRLLNIARKADPDPWRDEYRRALVGQDIKTLVSLGKKVNFFQQPPQNLIQLAGRIQEKGKDPIPLLQAALAHYPRDFWMLYSIAQLHKDPRERVGHFRAAVAIRPNSTSAWTALGKELIHCKHFAAAVPAFRKATSIDPKSAVFWANLGVGLLRLNKPQDAEAACKRESHPKFLRPKIWHVPCPPRTRVRGYAGQALLNRVCRMPPKGMIIIWVKVCVTT